MNTEKFKASAMKAAAKYLGRVVRTDILPDDFEMVSFASTLTSYKGTLHNKNYPDYVAEVVYVSSRKEMLLRVYRSQAKAIIPLDIIEKEYIS